MDTSGRLWLSALGAAKRRRDGRFRAWHRHDGLTVAMVLSAALHHIAQRPRRREVGVLEQFVEKEQDGASGKLEFVGKRASKETAHQRA